MCSCFSSAPGCSSWGPSSDGSDRDADSGTANRREAPMSALAPAVELALALLTGWYVAAHLVAWRRTGNRRYGADAGWLALLLGFNLYSMTRAATLAWIPLLLLAALAVVLGAMVRKDI